MGTRKMRFTAVIGMCSAANLVTRTCSRCPAERRGTLTETNLDASETETTPQMACCSSGSLSTCAGVTCYGCGAADGCSGRRREVMSDDFDDLDDPEQDIGFTEGDDGCNP